MRRPLQPLLGSAARRPSWAGPLGLVLAVVVLTAAPAGADLSGLLPGAADVAPLAPGKIDRYGADTLWERIDGEAELYRQFGLREAAAEYFDDPSDATRSVEVLVFETETPLGAFGLFASMRRPGEDAEGFGNCSVVGSSLGFFWHGAHFVLAHALGPEATRPGDLRRALGAVDRRLGRPPAPPPLLAAFDALVAPGTAVYRPDHLLGRASLPPGLEGAAPSGTRVFVATASTPLADLEAYAKVLEGALLAEGSLSGTDPDLGPITLVLKGSRLAGARTRPEEPGTAQLLERLLGLPAVP